MQERDPLDKLQGDYKATFKNPVGRAVLEDLNIFCHGTKTTAGFEDDIKILEGRRQVFLRIMSLLEVNFSEVYTEYVDDSF